jgi:alkanesulfonate monooxygenase SsuD/methylene tetrahydromethanopterin reductase-like flavin-dependent oxidoreductase (luciferase family)
MRFGIFDHLERRSDVGLAQQYEDRLRLMEIADDAGFTGYHVAEHHHSPLCLAPNQAVYLSAVAQRTKRMRIGPLVYVLPLHHPIRLIEEVSMVDQMSGGRFMLGVGPGTGGGTEYAMWGGNAEENRARFEETLSVLRAGLRSEFLTHHGTFFDYEDLWMELRPVQDPPDFWWAGQAESAAQRGANYVGTGSIRGMTESMATYRKEAEAVARDHAPDLTPPKDPLYGGMKHLFVADTDEEAREIALRAYRTYRTHYAKPTSTNRNPGPPPPGRGPSGIEPERALEVGALLAGSPATLRKFAQEYQSVGANYFVGAFQWGDLTHEEAAHSMRLFASEVMPAFE